MRAGGQAGYYLLALGRRIGDLDVLELVLADGVDRIGICGGGGGAEQCEHASFAVSGVVQKMKLGY